MSESRTPEQIAAERPRCSCGHLRTQHGKVKQAVCYECPCEAFEGCLPLRQGMTDGEANEARRVNDCQPSAQVPRYHRARCRCFPGEHCWQGGRRAADRALAYVSLGPSISFAIAVLLAHGEQIAADSLKPYLDASASPSPSWRESIRALRDYGRHHDGCATQPTTKYFPGVGVGQTMPEKGAACNCGFDAVLSRLAAQPETRVTGLNGVPGPIRVEAQPAETPKACGHGWHWGAPCDELGQKWKAEGGMFSRREAADELAQAQAAQPAPKDDNRAQLQRQRDALAGLVGLVQLEPETGKRLMLQGNHRYVKAVTVLAELDAALASPPPTKENT